MPQQDKIFCGDWLEEVSHPWREPDRKSSPKSDSRSEPGSSRLTILVSIVILVFAGLIVAGLMIKSTGHAASTETIKPHAKPGIDRRINKPPSSDHSSFRHQLRIAVADGIPAEMFGYYHHYAAEFSLPWQLLAAIGTNESGNGTSEAPGVHSDIGYSGCCGGVMEICFVSSCGEAATHYGIDGDGDGVVSIFEDADSVATAANILADFRKKYGNDMALLMAAYNAGAGAVDEYHGVPPYPETESYVRKGLQTMQRLEYHDR